MRDNPALEDVRHSIQHDRQTEAKDPKKLAQDLLITLQKADELLKQLSFAGAEMHPDVKSFKSDLPAIRKAVAKMK